MSDFNAEWANALACRWAEGHLNLPKGSVTKVSYEHEDEHRISDYTWDPAYDAIMAHLKEPVPDPSGSTDKHGKPYVTSMLWIDMDLGRMISSMLSFAESVIACGEEL